MTSTVFCTGDLVLARRESPIREQRYFTGLLVSLRQGRPVVVNTVRVGWDSVGIVLDVRIGRYGNEGGEHDDALVHFPEGLIRVPEMYLRAVGGDHA